MQLLYGHFKVETNFNVKLILLVRIKTELLLNYDYFKT